MEYNLEKEIKQNKEFVFNLAKSKGIADGQQAMVKLVLDISGSMSNLYSSGYVQRLLERIVPIALQFDDNQSLELYLFHNSAFKVGDVTMANLEGFVQREIMRKYSFGGTSYAPVIKLISEEYSPNVTRSGTGSTGLFGGLFGKKNDTKVQYDINKSAKLQLPGYCIFVTDGENDDHAATEDALRAASYKGLHWVFIGIGNERFSFLSKLDDLDNRLIDNAAFFKMPDLTKATNDELYGNLLKEFPQWLKDAKSKNLIP